MEYKGRLSGPRWNMLVDKMVERFEERVSFFEQMFVEQGYPPFTEPLSPIQQYQTLVAWRQAGDPRFWESVEAQAALAELSQRYGAPPPLSPYSQQAHPRLM